MQVRVCDQSRTHCLVCLETFAKDLPALWFMTHLCVHVSVVVRLGGSRYRMQANLGSQSTRQQPKNLEALTCSISLKNSAFPTTILTFKQQEHDYAHIESLTMSYSKQWNG